MYALFYPTIYPIHMMVPLNLPPVKLTLSRKGEQVVVWCVIRKKHLLLTPEEWVRQHAIHFLINERQTPIGRINSEHLVQINGQARRCDIVVFSEFGKPALIVECKATSIPIDEKTFLQTSNYVQKLQAPYFWMTNGLQHVMMDCRNPGVYLNELPPIL